MDMQPAPVEMLVLFAGGLRSRMERSVRTIGSITFPQRNHTQATTHKMTAGQGFYPNRFGRMETISLDMKINKRK
jgi:hypothetical protein